MADDDEQFIDSGDLKLSTPALSANRRKSLLRDLAVSVEIIGHQQAKDHGKDTVHINYMVQVNVGVSGSTSTPTIRWTVARRYRAFEALHEELSKIYGKRTLPSLPKKSLLRSFDANYIDTKQKGLQQYIRDLLLDPEIGRSSQLCSFLIGSFDEVFGSWLSSPLAPAMPNTPPAPAASSPASSQADQALRAELKLSMESQQSLQQQLEALQQEVERARKSEAKQQQQHQDAHAQSQSEVERLRAELDQLQRQQSALVEMVGQRDAQLVTAAEEIKLLKSHKKVCFWSF